MTTQKQIHADKASNPEGENVSDIQFWASRVRDLTQSVDWWNVAITWSLFLAGFFAVAVGVTTGIAFRKAKQLGDAQEKLGSAKEAQLTLDLGARDLKIEEAKAEAAKANLELAKFKAPRVLSEEQQSRMKAILVPFAGTPYELAVTPIPEAISFVTDLDKVLRSAGWTYKESARKDFRFSFTLGTGSKAEQVFVNNIVVGWTQATVQKHKAAIDALGKALGNEGFIVSGEVLKDDDPSPDNIRVGVGAKL